MNVEMESAVICCLGTAVTVGIPAAVVYCTRRNVRRIQKQQARESLGKGNFKRPDRYVDPSPVIVIERKLPGAFDHQADNEQMRRNIGAVGSGGRPEPSRVYPYTDAELAQAKANDKDADVIELKPDQYRIRPIPPDC